MGVYIENMKMPESCPCELVGVGYDMYCSFAFGIPARVKKYDECCENGTRPDWCPLVPAPPHGRLVDADALAADLKRQCKEVFKTDAVSPDDFWITRNQAYNERLWTTWCESLFDYLKDAPTIIPADKDINVLGKEEGE